MARWHRLTAPAMGLIAALALAAPASASVYWANFASGSGTTIGRAAGDGAGAIQSFISSASAPIGVAVDGSHIYWANEKTNSIGRANLDGTGADPGFMGGAHDPFGVAVDGAHIYWTNVQANSIGRANLDGSGANDSFITGASDPEGIAVDGQHIYWANAFSKFIGRANLDGSGVNQGFILESNSPSGVAVDAQHIYWTNVVEGTIGRANLDGSGLDNNFITGASDPIGIAVDAQHVYWANASANSLSRADLNGGGIVRNLVGASDPYGVALDAAASAVGAPSVGGERVLGIGTGSATVGALVNPNGGPTRYHVEWGRTPAYGSVGPDLPTGAPLTGQGDQAVAGQLTGLAPGTTYHWRIVASNSAGTTMGNDQTLTTSASGPTPTATFTITPPPAAGARTVISAAGSSGNGSPIVSYAWDWTDDGTVDATCNGSDPVAMPVFMQTGTYHVGLQVTSADGQAAFTAGTVTVSHVPTGGAPGVGLVAGYGCASLIHNAVCTNHIEWDLIVADTLDNGCFTEVPVGTGTAICHVCAAGDGGDSEPVAYVPPPVAKWLHKTNAKVWQTSSRVLVNGTIIAPQPQVIRVGGLLNPTKLVVREKSVLINEVDDSIFSGSADVYVKGNGGLPDTLLARGQEIYARLPESAPPPSLGALDAARAVPGRRSPDTIHADGDSGLVNPCADPRIKDSPTLGDHGQPFPDPSSLGFGSAVDGFPLSGPVTVHVVNDQAIVCVDVELPSLLPCPGDGQGNFVLKAKLVADQSGLELQNLRARLPCATIAGVVFSNVRFDYQAAGHHWEARGTVEAIPGLPLTGDVTFDQGNFVSAIVGLENGALAVPPVQVTKVEVGVYPDKTTGEVDLGLVPVVPVVNKSLLDISGRYTLNWGATPPYFELDGDASSLGFGPFASAWVKVQPRSLTFHTHFGGGLFGIRAQADVNGALWSVDPLKFNVEGDGTLSVLDVVNISGSLLISDRGAAGCVAIVRDAGPAHFHLHVGVAVNWSPFGIDTMFTGCDVGVERDAGGPARDVRARTAQAGFRIPVAGGTQYEIIGAEGAGAPPAVELDGPDGTRLTAPASGPILNAHYAVLHDAAHNTTYVIVHSPASGTWSVNPAAGSAPITAVHFATNLPPAAVKASVTGGGLRRRLSYTIRRIPGQVVRFVERGPNSLASIGTVSGGGHGVIRFRPAAGPAGKRQIVALVQQNGHPRAQVIVATYTAPAPARLTRPSGLRAVRRGGSLKFTWGRVPGAMAYAIRIRTSDRRSITTLVTGPRFTLLRVARSTSASITVAAVDSRGHGPARSLRVAPAKPRRRSR